LRCSEEDIAWSKPTSRSGRNSPSESMRLETRKRSVTTTRTTSPGRNGPDQRPPGSPRRRPYCADCPACNGHHKAHTCPPPPIVPKVSVPKDVQAALKAESGLPQDAPPAPPSAAAVPVCPPAAPVAASPAVVVVDKVASRPSSRANSPKPNSRSPTPRSVSPKPTKPVPVQSPGASNAASRKRAGSPAAGVSPGGSRRKGEKENLSPKRQRVVRQ
ncbi:hypothetical protein TeGR_g4501, partial [Tetraparma gracilis]